MVPLDEGSVHDDQRRLRSRIQASAERVGRDLAPFSAILLRTESVVSSRIENLRALAKAIALAELGDTAHANVIAANTTVMHAAIALADRLDGDAILAIHRAGTGRPPAVPARLAARARQPAASATLRSPRRANQRRQSLQPPDQVSNGSASSFT